MAASPLWAQTHGWGHPKPSEVPRLKQKPSAWTSKAHPILFQSNTQYETSMSEVTLATENSPSSIYQLVVTAPRGYSLVKYTDAL